MTATTTTVGDRLIAEAFRQKLVNSEHEFAFEIGVTYETVRKWKKGHTAPNRNRAKVIAEFLGKTEAWVTHGVTPDSVDLHSNAAHNSGATAAATKSEVGSYPFANNTTLKFAPAIDLVSLGVRDVVDMNEGDGYNALAIPGNFGPKIRLSQFPDDSMEPEVFKNDPVVVEIGATPWNNDIVFYRPKSDSGPDTVLPGRCIYSRIGNTFTIRTNKPEIYPDVPGDEVDIVAVVMHRLLGRTGLSPRLSR